MRLRNGPQTTDLQQLDLNSEVLIWRENKGWSGPFRLLAIDGELCSVEVPNGPSNFRSTAVKPYLRNNGNTNKIISGVAEPELTVGRRNPSRRRLRPNRYCEKFFAGVFINQIPLMTTFLTNKEKMDIELAKELRSHGVIIIDIERVVDIVYI